MANLRRSLGFLPLLAVLTASSSLVAADLSFTLAASDPSFSTVTTSGFHLAFESGSAVLSKDSGTGNGEVHLLSNFFLSGDFDFSVQADGLSVGSSSESGLGASQTNCCADVFFASYAGTQINGNLPSHATGFTSGSSGTFEIKRVGTVLTDLFNGSVVNSDPNSAFTGPVQVEVFFIEELNATDGGRVSFHNLVISADSIMGPAPEPTTWLLMGVALVGFAVCRARA